MEAMTRSNLTLENRQSLSVTGIKKVRTTEPNQVVAVLDNCMILVSGSNLSVENLSIKEGILEVSGNINGIRYTNNRTKRFSVKNMFR